MRKFTWVSCAFLVLFLTLISFLPGQPKTALASSTILSPRPSIIPNPYSSQNASQDINVIVILAEFSDARHTVSREIIKQQVFTEMRDYYLEASYGKVSIKGDIIQDWIALPTKFSSYGNMLGFSGMNDSRFKLAFDVVKAADSEVDYKKYNQVIIVLPRVSMVNFSLQEPIVTNDACILSWVTVQTENVGPIVLAHELGHSIGLPDLYDHRKAEYDNFDVSPYAGHWCLMSYTDGGPVHFCAFSKMVLGWIPDERIQVVPAGTTELINLEPVEIETDGTQVIKIPGHGQAYYLVEARQKIGFDEALPDEGVLVTHVDETLATKGTKEGGYLLISGPYGFVQVQDAEPDTSSLNDATFDVRPGKKNVFIERKDNLGIVVLRSNKDGYQICITTPDSAKQMSKVIDAVSQTISKASQADFDSPEAQSLLKESDNKYFSVIHLLITNNYAGAMQEVDTMTSLIDKAISAENSYTEVTEVQTIAKGAIQKAESEGRTDRLNEANNILQQAQSKLDTYDYNGAIVMGVKAKRIATDSTSPHNLLESYGWYISIGVVAAAAIVAGIWFVKRKGKRTIIDE